MTHPTTDYAQRVDSGKILASRWVHRSTARHLADLKSGTKRGLYFDEDAASHAVAFFSFLKHWKGRQFEGKPFDLADWQAFVVGSLFGWKLKDSGLRRFRHAYVEVGRKNGKTHLLAGMGLYCLDFDDEPGAEVYAAATKKDQAKEVWTAAKEFSQRNAEIRKRIKLQLSTNTLYVQDTASKFTPLGRDSDTMDGMNPHFVSLDELHAHKDRGVLDVLDSGMGAREQPLRVAITTAGFDRLGICREQRDYACKVLDGILKDDSFFGYVACLDTKADGADEDDDPFDESLWIKANPTMPAAPAIEYLRQRATYAKANPAALNEFLRKHCCIWTEQNIRWMPMDEWRACDLGGCDPERLKGRSCFAGVDLGRTRDLSALVLYFPPQEVDDDDEEAAPAEVLCWYWCPADDIVERSRRDLAPYDVFERTGRLVATPGNATDFSFIKKAILDLGEVYRIREIAFDPWNATQLITELVHEGAECVPVRQGAISLSEPCKELMRQVLRREIDHGGHPILEWNASNVTVISDSNGNIKPDKSKSIEKIDGIIALVMAINRWLAHRDTDTPSVYEERGILELG